MPGSAPPVTLRLQPQALPSVKAAFEEALVDLGIQLARLTRSGFIPEAWMGDPISEDVRVFYNTTVIESSDSTFAALMAYQSELTRIRDSLEAMEAHYLTGEDQVAGDVRQLRT